MPLTDTSVSIIAATITSTVAALGTIVTAILQWKTANRVVVMGNKVETVETKIEEVHKATNGMKDELVRVKLIEGHAQGVEDERARQDIKDAAIAEGVKIEKERPKDNPIIPLALIWLFLLFDGMLGGLLVYVGLR